jgi:hypothetical protein
LLCRISSAFVQTPLKFRAGHYNRAPIRQSLQLLSPLATGKSAGLKEIRFCNPTIAHKTEKLTPEVYLAEGVSF